MTNYITKLICLLLVILVPVSPLYSASADNFQTTHRQAMLAMTKCGGFFMAESYIHNKNNNAQLEEFSKNNAARLAYEMPIICGYYNAQCITEDEMKKVMIPEYLKTIKLKPNELTDHSSYCEKMVPYPHEYYLSYLKSKGIDKTFKGGVDEHGSPKITYDAQKTIGEFMSINVPQKIDDQTILKDINIAERKFIYSYVVSEVGKDVVASKEGIEKIIIATLNSTCSLKGYLELNELAAFEYVYFHDEKVVNTFKVDVGECREFKEFENAYLVGKQIGKEFSWVIEKDGDLLLENNEKHCCTHNSSSVRKYQKGAKGN